MIKFLHCVAIAALVSSALYAYSIKYGTTLEAAQLQKVRAQAQREREMIAVLRAEWAFLNRPDRVQDLADRHLDLTPVKTHQIVRFSDIPMRGPKVDEIGRKLADLGLGQPTQTPTGTRAGGGATTPGARP